MTPLIDQINEAINQAAEKYQESAQGYDVLDEAFKDGANLLMPIVKLLLEQRDNYISQNIYEPAISWNIEIQNAELIKLLKEQAK